MELSYLVQQANKLIPKPRHGDFTIHKEGNTQDIINAILYADSQIDNSMCDFAKLFTKDLNGLKKLWLFVNQSLTYRLDPKGDERVKSPQRTWADRFKGGNCKGYSLFIASILKCNGIKYRYAFPTFKGNPYPTHVYIIATINKTDIVLDSTIDKFNYAEPYARRQELKPMTKISYLNQANSNANKSANIRTKRAIPKSPDMPNAAPLRVAKKSFIDYSEMTEGQLTMALMNENLNIYDAYYGDPLGEIAIKKDILNDFIQGSQVSISAPVQNQFNTFFNWLNYAKNNNKVAGTNLKLDSSVSAPLQTREEVLAQCDWIKTQYNRYLAKFENCGIRPSASCLERVARAKSIKLVKQDGSEYNTTDLVKDYTACNDKRFFVDVFNANLENAAHHLIYEFLNPNDFETRATVNFKIQNQRLANSNFALFSTIDRANIIAWESNGAARRNAGLKLADISPKGFIQEFARIEDPTAQIGVAPVVLLGAIASALLAASELLKTILDKRASVVDNFKGLGTEGFGPEKTDWLKAAGEAVKDNDLLIPGLIVATGVAAYAMSK